MSEPSGKPSVFSVRARQGFEFLRRCVLAATVILVASPNVAYAEDDSAPVRETVLRRVWGTAEPSTLNVGMWTRHVDRVGVDRSNLYGATYRGIFVATFLNSFHERSYAIALERRAAWGKVGPITFGAGYRLGAIHGYDERMIPFAGRVPVVPFVQALGDVMWKNRVGVQASFCVKVVTWGGIVRF